MKRCEIDIPVALIFFNRPDCLKKTFSAIREARPSRLFLIQDGPRENRSNDVVNIQKCREIVDQIDWQCNVTKLYSDHNLGCGQRVFSGITEAFKDVDRLVIIEDDIVIGQSFLRFCCDLLERYKDDERIAMISGMNHVGEYENCPYDYFFSSQGGAIWGWATWKRVWENFDWGLECIEDSYACNCLSKTIRPKSFYKQLIGTLKSKRSSILKQEEQTSWSFQFGFPSTFLQHRLNIIPTKNQISNIGFSIDSAHSSPLHRIPRGLRKVYNGERYSITFPLSHPKYVVDDFYYADLQGKVLGSGTFRKIYRFFEAHLYKLLPFLGR